MNRSLSLKTNFSWTFISNLIYAGSQWGMLVVLARLGTVEMVGQFGLGLAVGAPIIMLSNMQLSAIQATDTQEKYEFADYFGLRLISTLLAFMVIFSTAHISYDLRTAQIISLMGVAKAIEALSDIVYGLLQQHERMDRIAISKIIKGLTTLPMMAIGVIVFHNVIAVAIAMAFTWVCLFVFYDLRSAQFILDSYKKIYPRFHLADLYQLFLTAFPMGIVMMLISLNANIPRILVERYHGEASLGIFTSLSYILVVGTTVVSALGQSASPRLAQYYADGNRPAFVSLLLKLVGIGVSMGMGGVMVALVAGEFILNLLYGPVYVAEVGVFVWLMVAGGIMYVGSFLGYAITATWQFQRFTVPYTLNTIVVALSAFVLISGHGLYGAAWTLMVAGIMSCLTPVFILFTIQKETKDYEPSARKAS